MIVVTTPTGQIGRRVVDKLLESDEPVRVIARDPSCFDPEVRGRVEVVEGSHGDPRVVNEAFADAVFWVVPPIPKPRTSRTTIWASPGRRATRSGAWASSAWSASLAWAARWRGTSGWCRSRTRWTG